MSFRRLLSIIVALATTVAVLGADEETLKVRLEWLAQAKHSLQWCQQFGTPADVKRAEENVAALEKEIAEIRGELRKQKHEEQG